MGWDDVAMVVDALRARAPVPRQPAGALSDYHVHTCWSDGDGQVAEMIAQAVDLGLPEVGLTDHLVPYDPDDDYGIPHDRLAAYVAAVREESAAAQSRIRVFTSVEVDYAPRDWPHLLALLAEHGFDYVIGSVHGVDGKPIDYIEEMVRKNWPDDDLLYARYYEAVAEMAASGVVDVAGHLDLPKKFGRRPGAAARPAEDAALDAIAAAGVLVEINTSGLRYPVGELFPSADLLARAHGRGIGITFGSDAHEPGELAAGFDQALAAARAAGYSTCVRPSDRTEVPLP
jgi:histidinol-phosphatase (PHP family)